MSTPAESRVFGLDLMRASAILLVLVAHASFEFLPLTHRLEAVWMLGHYGVELFFVLSGFLIGGILARQAAAARLHAGRFWLRRWLRTLPNYYLFLLLNVAIARWTDGAWPHAASYAVFLQNFAWPQPLFFIESWSLSVEEVFYLVAPLLVLLWAAAGRDRGEGTGERGDQEPAPSSSLVGRGRRASPSSVSWIVIAIVIATAVRIAYVLALDPNWDLGVRMVTLVRLDAIAYGVLVMLLYDRAQGIMRRHAGAIALAGVAGLALSVWLYLVLAKDTSVFARTGLFSLISASFAAFLPAAANWRETGLPAPIANAVRAIARWSYALYLCQLGVMRVMNATFAGNAQSFAGCLLQALLFIALSIAVAALVFGFFEAPILRWRDRVTRDAPRPRELSRAS